MNKWERIRDCLHGRGVRDSDGKVIWQQDVHQHLKSDKNVFNLTNEELDKFYEELEPFLAAELERRKNLPPTRFDKFTIPHVRKVYPKILV